MNYGFLFLCVLLTVRFTNYILKDVREATGGRSLAVKLLMSVLAATVEVMLVLWAMRFKV